MSPRNLFCLLISVTMLTGCAFADRPESSLQNEGLIAKYSSLTFPYGNFSVIGDDQLKHISLYFGGSHTSSALKMCDMGSEFRCMKLWSRHDKEGEERRVYCSFPRNGKVSAGAQWEVGKYKFQVHDTYETDWEGQREVFYSIDITRGSVLSWYERQVFSRSRGVIMILRMRQNPAPPAAGSRLFYIDDTQLLVGETGLCSDYWDQYADEGN